MSEGGIFNNLDMDRRRTPPPAGQDLAAARRDVERLEQELDAARRRVAGLQQRHALDALAKQIAEDERVQRVAQDLETARAAFAASLVPPPDFDVADGDFEDTDEFADIRDVDKAVDAALVVVGELMTSSPASGFRTLACVTHFVARVADMLDEAPPRAKDVAADALEDLRGDITEMWKEFAPRVVSLQLDGTCPEAMSAALGLLEIECGGYYAEATAALRATERGSPIPDDG